jgi:hypothetical protein
MSSPNKSTPISTLTSPKFKTCRASDNEVKINEEVSLTKKQLEVLNIICNTYKELISQYMKDALIDKMQSDIEDGDFSDVLLSKLHEEEDEGKTYSSLSSTGKEYDNILDP